MNLGLNEGGTEKQTQYTRWELYARLYLQRSQAKNKKNRGDEETGTVYEEGCSETLWSESWESAKEGETISLQVKQQVNQESRTVPPAYMQGQVEELQWGRRPWENPERVSMRGGMVPWVLMNVETDRRTGRYRDWLRKNGKASAGGSEQWAVNPEQDGTETTVGDWTNWQWIAGCAGLNRPLWLTANETQVGAGGSAQESNRWTILMTKTLHDRYSVFPH